jgi:hypothetical protein
MDFASNSAEAIIASGKATGASAESLAKLTAAIDALKIQSANPIYCLPITFLAIFPVDLLGSLIPAGLLRNSRFLSPRRS